nr:uncharacterized protein LOC114826659 isoform X1 [Malus domestica]
MHRRPKATSRAKAKSKSLAGQGSGHAKNPIPAQPTKLRGEIRSPFEKKKERKAAVKDSPTTHLKNVKAVADSLAQIQLEEKGTCPAFSKEDKIPKCIVEPRIVSELPSSCPICTKFGHAPEQCPWRRRLPFGVTQVGKGYEIYGRRVHILWCSFCDEIGHHRTSECLKPNKKIEKTRLWKEFFFPEDKDS